jgi:hypothetical protein
MAESGYFLRVGFGQSKAASQAAVAQAWRAVGEAQLAGGGCATAKEMVFFDPSGEAGAGILFPIEPPGWNRIQQDHPEWRLLDGASRPVAGPVCFFPADEARRPAGWAVGEPGAAVEAPTPTAQAPTSPSPAMTAGPAASCSSYVSCDSACSAGAMNACVAAGTMLFNGAGGATKDEPGAYALFAKACEGGDAAGCSNRGWRELAGQGTTKDPAKALASFELACNERESIGCFGVGVVLRDRRGAADVKARAKAAFARACDGGLKVACKERDKLP